MMGKRILIVTSAYTGAGHKSVSDALVEQFSVMPGVEVKVIDGFDLAGWFGLHTARLYGSMIRHAPWLYNLSWRMTDAKQPRFPLGTMMCRRRFAECLKSYNPDLILTVHSLFNTVLTKLVRKNGLDIPVVVVQADLVKIHSTWCNREAAMTICATEEAYNCSLGHDMDADRLKVIGFPVRSRFVEAARSSEKKDHDPSTPLKILLMGGGEGSIGLKSYALKILADPNVILTIVCGRNKKLCAKLRKSIGTEYEDRVNILGFVDNIEQEMLDNDLLIARGSPNTLCEAVMIGIPVIMTGPFLEQERGNFTLAREKNLGVICDSPDDVMSIIKSLTADDDAGLKKIRAAQDSARRFDNAYNIASYVAGY